MEKQKDPNIFQIAYSIIASFFGVQNKKNYERDNAYIEKHGIKPYVIIGFSLAILFFFTLYCIVRLVLYFVQP